MKYIFLEYIKPGKFEEMTEESDTQCWTNALGTMTICAPTEICVRCYPSG